jgi:hypothetical protein
MKRPAHAVGDPASAEVHCDQIVPLLQSAHEDGLDAATLERTLAHVAICPRCGPRFEERLANMYALVRAAPAMEPPAAIERRLYARITAAQRSLSMPTQTTGKVLRPMHDSSDSALSTEHRYEPPTHTPRRLGVWIGTVAALLVVGLLGTTLFSLARFRGASPGDSPTACAANAIKAQLPPKTSVFDLAMTSSIEGWAVGVSGSAPYAGTIFHYQQCRWTTLPETYPDALLESISMVSPTEGWAVGGLSSGRTPLALHCVDGRWQRVSIPMASDFQGVFQSVRMVNADEGWMLSLPIKDPQGRISYSLSHYRDGVWTLTSTPLRAISDIAPVGADDLWIAGAVDERDQSHSVFGHYQSGKWTTLMAPVDVQITALRALSPTDIWAEGSVTSKESATMPAIVHYDGASWSQVMLSGDQSNQVVEMLSANDAWAFGLTQNQSSPSHIERVEHFTSGTWHSVAWPFDDIETVRGLTRVADGSYWAIGGYMIDKTKPNDPNAGYGGSLFLHYANGSWRQYGHV